MSLSSDAGAPTPGLSRVLGGYGAAVALAAAATFVAVAVDRSLGASNLGLIFVLPVVIAAAAFGWGPSLVAAVVGLAAFNFFLIAPRHSFRVDDPANAWALGLLLVTAAIVSAVAARARARAIEARRHADQAQALQAFARTLMGAADRSGVSAASAEALARLFGAPAVVFLEEGGTLAPAYVAGGARVGGADVEAAKWALAARLPTRAGAYPIDQSAFDFWPVSGAGRWLAVIGVAFSGAQGERPADPERLVEIVGAYLSVALAREELAAQALEGRLAAAGQRLKADLLAAVSHDLKTPLSTILFTLQSLQRFGKAHDADARAELLRLAEVETARLAHMVGALLDMSRLEADAVGVRLMVVAPVELMARAGERAATALSGRHLVDEVDPHAPALFADPALAETALANILDNAGKYAPAGSTVRVGFEARGAEGVFEVADEGCGFPDAVEPLFEKFARGVQGDGRPPGTGLGLSIARGFAEAQGGRVSAENRDDGPGARVRLVLPLAQA